MRAVARPSTRSFCWTCATAVILVLTSRVSSQRFLRPSIHRGCAGRQVVPRKVVPAAPRGSGQPHTLPPAPSSRVADMATPTWFPDEQALAGPTHLDDQAVATYD